MTSSSPQRHDGRLKGKLENVMKEEPAEEDELPPTCLAEHENLLVSYYQLLPMIKGGDITNDVVGNLVASGFVSAQAIARATVRQLSKVHTMSKEMAEVVKKRINSITKLEGFRSAGQQHAKIQARRRLTTGSDAIDKVLGGGWSTHGLTEIAGAAGTLKTQMCHTAVLTSLLPENLGGLNKNSIFIDTEGSFTPQRIEEMCSRYDISFESVKDRIIYSFAQSSDHLLELLVQTMAIVSSGSYGIVVVDSIAKVLGREFNKGLCELSEKQGVLTRILAICTRIAESGVVFLLTNHVRAVITNTGLKEKSAGGHVMGHGILSSVLLRRGEFGKRIFALTKSASMPYGEAEFTIGTFTGICDVQKEEPLSIE